MSCIGREDNAGVNDGSSLISIKARAKEPTPLGSHSLERGRLRAPCGVWHTEEMAWDLSQARQQHQGHVIGTRAPRTCYWDESTKDMLLGREHQGHVTGTRAPRTCYWDEGTKDMLLGRGLLLEHR